MPSVNLACKSFFSSDKLAATLNASCEKVPCQANTESNLVSSEFNVWSFTSISPQHADQLVWAGGLKQNRLGTLEEALVRLQFVQGLWEKCDQQVQYPCSQAQDAVMRPTVVGQLVHGSGHLRKESARCSTWSTQRSIDWQFKQSFLLCFCFRKVWMY